MRVEVGTVRTLSVVTLGGAVATCACGLIIQGRNLGGGPAGSSLVVHLVAAYGLSLLSFAAFPRTRRTDLAKMVVLAAVFVQIVQSELGRGFSALHLTADAGGALAVLIPSFMERFRSLSRADPHEPFSMVYPGDRRRRPGQLFMQATRRPASTAQV